METKRRRKSWVCLWLVAVLISGCGGGGGSEDSNAPPTVIIQGIVTDDPVEGATVTLTALADNAVLATTVTGVGGAYTTPAIVESRLRNGYLITATGGTALGSAFVGTLRAVYSASSDYAQSHVTVLTTAVAQAAQGATADALLLATNSEEIANTAIARGLLPQQWRTLSVATDFARSAAAAISREGVDAFTATLAWRLRFVPTITIGTTCEAGRLPGDQICTARITSTGGEVRDMSGVGLGNVVAQAPAPANDCTLDLHAEVSSGGNAISAWASVPSGFSTSTTCSLVGPRFSGPITLRLPPLTAANRSSVLDVCASPDNDHPAMIRCVSESGIEPAVFVTDGQTHRVQAESHPTSALVSSESWSRTAWIERRYGATLKRSTSLTSTLSSASPVLFVHGYTLSGGFGGAESTWGSLPYLVWNLPLLLTSP